MRNYAAILEALDRDLGIGNNFVTSDLSLTDVRKIMLRKSFYKKLSPHRKPSQEQIQAASKKFLEVNRNLPDGEFVWVSENEAEACFYDYFRGHVNNALQTQSPDGIEYEDLVLGMTPGPGSAQKADSRTWHTKLFGSVMSYTDESLISLYRTAVSNSDSWSIAEKLRSERFGFTEVRGGKLFFVLKNVDEARTCCTEPLLNLLIQQGIRGFLTRRLKEYFGINLESQPAVNRRLAMLGSRDSSYGTMDLSSASDSNGLSLFQAVVAPSRIKRWITAARCEVAVLPDGHIEKLRMVSTMGNAFTFPLMTVLLSSAVRACLDLMDPDGTFSVFGDDIVAPVKVFPFLAKMLKKLGYLVNDDKSFSSGPFRESCGHDYFNGEFVRGVYIRSLETSADVYSAFNRLTRWSAVCGVPLNQTLRLLRSMAPGYLVPPAEDDLAGFKVPFKLTIPKLTSEYWFKYRCLKRLARKMVVAEPIEGLDEIYLPSLLVGVHKHPQSVSIGPMPYGMEVFLRDLPDAPPRMKVVSKSVPYWDYWPPESDPGEQWLPARPTKNLTEYDLDYYRLHTRGALHLWEKVLVNAVS